MKKAIASAITLTALFAFSGEASAKYKVFTVSMVGYCDVFTVKQFTRTFITVTDDPSSCAKAVGIGEIGKTNLSGSVATAAVVLNGDASQPLYMEMKFPLKGGLIQFFKIGSGGNPEQTMDTVYTVQRSRNAGPRSGPSLASVLNR
jgi:hypothetical protein